MKGCGISLAHVRFRRSGSSVSWARAAAWAWATIVALPLLAACEDAATRVEPAPATTAATAPTPLPDPPRAPDIIIDGANVSVGSDRIPAGEPRLGDRVGGLLTGRPAVAGQPVDVVAMRNARPAQVAAVVAALRAAKATRVSVKTEARDGTTQALPLSFASRVPDCAVTAWIAKDVAIDVWPAAGGTARRIIKGIAGPDMTLGTEAVERLAGGCGAPELIVGADDRLTWGLVFDLALMSLRAPGSHLMSAVLVTNAVPGRKVTLDSP